jgi:carboxyl-terminal processing protease
MQHRFRQLLAAFVLLAQFALVSAQSVSQPPAATAANTAANEAEAAKAKLIDTFATALALAKDKYAGQVDFDKLMKASVLGMLHTLDPHSSFLDPKEWERYKSEQNSHYSGIGAIIGERRGKVYILSPFADTPAFRAGLRYGDHIIEINGETTAGWGTQQVSSTLIGAEDTPVTVKVSRLGESQPLEFKLIRAGVPLPSVVDYFLINQEVGYINLQRGFNTTTHDEILATLDDLKDRGMKALILDIRGNRGGYVDQAWKVAGTFLRAGQKVVAIAGRPPLYQQRDLLGYNISPDEYPIVMLIDRNTASAAEIVAGALQDHDRALLIGERSFGKGLVQNIFELTNRSALTLTTGRYRTPSGRLIQRDYSNRSVYDYYVHRGDKGGVKNTEERRTDLGRTVYGGGGIAPDIELSTAKHDAELQRFWLEPVFEFVRLLAAGKIQGLANFKIDHAADHKHRLEATEFVINNDVMAAFKAFLHGRSEFNAHELRTPIDVDYIKQQIRFEIVTAAYGQEIAFQVLASSDAQIQRALREMPNARALADAARRLTTTAGNDGKK